MPAQIQFIPGPPVNAVTRATAERGLRNHEAIRKGASYALEQMDGHWVAAIVHADAPPFGGGDETEESAPPKAEGSGLSDSGPDDSDSSSDDDGPPKKKKGESGELSQVLQMLQQIGEALGIPLDGGMGDPNADPGAGSPPGPPGLGGPPPPGPPGGPGGDNTQHVIHEKTMKPGEVPPGGTPVGAPAFASVRRDHPWAHVANQVASFQVGPTPIGDTPIHKVAEELDRLSSEIGYRYKLREDRDEDGQRVAVAIITKH